MPIENWDRDRDGVIVCPLLEYEMALFHRVGICVRLSVLNRTAEGEVAANVQLALSPQQARAFATSLLDAVARAETAPPKEIPRQ